MYILFLMFFVTAFSCCDKDLDNLEARMSELNGNIAALQGLTEALKQGKQILSVSENWEGYTLTFSDQSTIKIYHGLNGTDGTNGTDGKDGAIIMPSVSVRDSSDGYSYWTVDGRLLINDSGKPVRADGDKGEAGTPGITPKIRIHPVTNEWETSVDGGVTWTTTGIKATGAKGDPGQPGTNGSPGTPGDIVFAQDGINIKEEYVEFTFRDGTCFRVPRYTGLPLHFPQGTDYRMPRGVEKLIPFKITGSASGFTVNAAGSNGWQAEVRMFATKADSGVVVITVPSEASKGSVIVLLDDGRGACRTYRLDMKSLLTGKMLPVRGGSLSIFGPHGNGWSVSDFWLGETEITCQQYCDFLNDLKPIPTKADIEKNKDTAWFNTWYYTDRHILIHNGTRRIPNSLPIHYSSGLRFESVANYPIAQKRPNFLGFYDMSGNAEEWCKDRSERKTTERQYPQNGLVDKENPQGPKDGAFYILRGGAYWLRESTVYEWTSGSPNSYDGFYMGFRLAYNPYYSN